MVLVQQLVMKIVIHLAPQQISNQQPRYPKTKKKQKTNKKKIYKIIIKY